MLSKLKEKFPGADVFKISEDAFDYIGDALFDTVISTLTIAHVKDIEATLNAWCSLLKPHAEMIITDFHPKMLAFGGKRTFSHNRKQMAVRNYVYPISTIKDILHENGFKVAAEDEFRIDETVKHYYANRNALPVYKQFKGFPVIYGIHLKRGDDPQ
jgi:ubiquinone/menaquinone biosynthesis C-methylase UbiE